MTCIALSKQDHKERTPCIFRKLGEIQSNRGGNLDTAPAGVFVVPPPVAAGPHAAMAAPPQGRNGALRRRRRPGPCCPGKQMGRGHTGAQTFAPRRAPTRARWSRPGHGAQAADRKRTGSDTPQKGWVPCVLEKEKVPKGGGPAFSAAFLFAGSRNAGQMAWPLWRWPSGSV